MARKDVWPTPTKGDAEGGRTTSKGKDFPTSLNASVRGLGKPVDRAYQKPLEGEVVWDKKEKAWRTTNAYWERMAAHEKAHGITPEMLSEGIMWPTPNVPNGGRSPKAGKVGPTGKTKDGKKRQVDLATAVKTWPTPKASPSGPDFARMGREGSGGDDLATAVERERREKFPTPRVEDGQCTGGHRGKEDSLHAKAKRWASPAARDWRSGKGRKDNGHSPQLPEQAGGQLNPDWVELLMGWPPGWTKLSPEGEAFYASIRGAKTGKKASPASPSASPTGSPASRSAATASSRKPRSRRGPSSARSRRAGDA